MTITASTGIEITYPIPPVIQRSRRGWRLCSGRKWRIETSPLSDLRVTCRVRGFYPAKLSENVPDREFWGADLLLWQQVARRLLELPEVVRIPATASSADRVNRPVWMFDFDPYLRPHNAPRQRIVAKLRHGHFRSEDEKLALLTAWAFDRAWFRAETPVECVGKLVSFYTGNPLKDEIARVEAELALYSLEAA